MSKYKALWKYVQQNGSPSFQLTFDEVAEIAGIAIDHSFLKYKKELAEYGYQVGKISLKEHTVFFDKMDSESIRMAEKKENTMKKLQIGIIEHE